MNRERHGEDPDIKVILGVGLLGNTRLRLDAIMITSICFGPLNIPEIIGGIKFTIIMN